MGRRRRPSTRIEQLADERSRQVRRSVAEDLRRARSDAGLSMRRLAAAAGVSTSTLSAIEHDKAEPSVAVIARLSTALGMSLSVRLYPGTGPLIHDHLQAALLQALLEILDERWRPTLEVAVQRPVRGVIDIVLDDHPAGVAVACEAQSELRRLEQQIRWSKAKADALGLARGRSKPSRLLLLRATRRNQHVVSEYAALIRASYPARTADLFAALSGSAPWPGDGLLWCRVDARGAMVMGHPPRGVPVGR